MARPIGTLIILGAGGDLARRLLLPALGELLNSNRGTDIELIGVDASPMTEAEWRSRVSEAFADAGISTGRAAAIAARSTHIHADVTDSAALADVLRQSTGTPALYFALPPHVTIAACSAMLAVDLPAGTVLCMEKPFGTDLASARGLNRLLEQLVPESQIHRIDHFLGKSTVLNLLGLRFANRLFEGVWNRDNIERVDIVFDETLALEGRAGYYDRAGALVDMIQSHLLLVLSIVAMEPPSSLDADDLRGAMAQVLRATNVLDRDGVPDSRRGRYLAGSVDGRPIPAYTDEDGVDPGLSTETLAELTVGISTWRWAGVPFRLRSGKALSDRRQEMVVTFKDVPHRPVGLTGDPGPARLRIALDPEGMQVDVNVNAQGDPFTLDRVRMSVELATGELPAYGEVLAGILASDPTLAVRSDAVEECWRIVSPVLDAWSKNQVTIDGYSAGSSGPEKWAPPA